MEIVHTEEKEGFTITLAVQEEIDSPDWDMTEEELEETIQRIKDGSLLWFCARVEAYKNGICLARYYLGGCCYLSIDDFKNGGYYEDMVTNVIREAKEKIQELTGE